MSDEKLITRRQDSKKCYSITTFGYITNPSYILKSDNLFAGQVGGYLVQRNQSIDIDNIDNLSVMIGDAALKYYILKPDAKKDILFNPAESIDFNGHTGPFIQYTYVRIKSILYKNDNNSIEFNDIKLAKKEKELIIMLCEFKNVLNNSVKTLNPSLIANHIYELVKLYNSYYQTHTILGDKSINSFRVFLSEKVAFQIKKSMALLGVSVPDRM